MILSSASLALDETLIGDIAIVGTGAAGIPLALTLAEAGLKVLLLEGGRDQADPETQSLYSGTVSDAALHNPPDTYRHRRLGGSTVIWGGRCVPYDPVDFEARPFVPYSGWPIAYDEVAKYYASANLWLEAGEADYDARTALEKGTPPLIAGFSSRRVKTDGLERFSRPTDLYSRYRKRLDVNPNIQLVFSANCTHIELSSDGCSVDYLKCASLEGARFSVKADRYILAVGGIETARLLLASNNVAKDGVGNSHGLVGRFYQCHIAGNVGKLTFFGRPHDIRHNYEVSGEGIYCRRRISLTQDEQIARRVNNVVMRLHFPKITDPSHRNGVLSGLFMARRFISYEYATRLRDGDQSDRSVFIRHLFNIVTTPLDTLKFALNWLFKRTLAVRKFPSVILTNKTNVFSLEVSGEQVPNPDSRITLIDEKDALGMPKVNIDWKYVPQDIQSVRKSLQVFAEELEASGLGQLEIDDANFERELMRFGAYGGHHIGTARMADRPDSGVVDSNSRVHGVDNLYIASSAVFPTSGQANPTLLIVALAMRLADHLIADQSRSAAAAGSAQGAPV